MANNSGRTPAIAYLRTSSAANVGGDSDVRQRESIKRYAKGAGLKVVQEFYDAAVSGADPVDQRPGFGDLLAYSRAHGVTTILVENASRFARDLVVQLTGHDLLKAMGIALIPVDAPDHFTDETPTAVMVRQILGAVSQFEKAGLVAKLKGARDRASAAAGHRVEGRKGYSETAPDLVKEAKRLARKSPRTGEARSLREIASELATLGFLNGKGQPFAAAQVTRLLGREKRQAAA